MQRNIGGTNMFHKIAQITKKITTYLKYHTLGETVHWLWHRVISRVRKKLAGPQGVSAAAPAAYAAEEKKAQAAGKIPVNWPDYRRYLLTEEEATTVSLKHRRSVFIFATIPYYDIGGGQRSSQLAKTFNKMGYAVHYIYGFKSSDFNQKNYIPIPCVSHMHIDALTIADFSELIGKDDLMILEGPVAAFVPYAQAAKAQQAKVIYENIDIWETSLGSGVYSDRKDLNTLLTCSDLLVGTAKLLVEQLQRYCSELQLEKQIVYLPNAVDDELFAARLQYEQPKDMVLGTKTLVYYGSLWGEWFDWELIFGLAKSDASISINLIGDHEPIPHIRRKAPDNVHFLGLKKQTELPAYLKYADFALIPFKTGEIGDYVSPLKIFEYIAMNKNVLTTALPDVAGYPNLYSGNDLQTWIDTVTSAGEPDEAAAEDFTASNTWANRIQNMLDRVYPTEAQRCSDAYYGKLSIVVLNYNNKGIIDKCVASLLRYRDRYAYEVVVVDNCSKDGSYEQLQERFGSSINLVRNSKNGCSSGRNLGVSVASGDYILFLDSDQWATDRYWLDAYLHIHETADNFGAVAWNGGWFDKYGAAYVVVDSFAFRYMAPSALYRGDIGYLATCGFLMDKAVFNQIDGFDEYYDPTCYEDTDLSLKIRHAGLEFYYSPYLGVVHLPHQSTKAGTESHLKLITEKQKYFVQKWRELNPKLLEYIKEH